METCYSRETIDKSSFIPVLLLLVLHFEKLLCGTFHIRIRDQLVTSRLEGIPSSISDRYSAAPAERSSSPGNSLITALESCSGYSAKSPQCRVCIKPLPLAFTHSLSSSRICIPGTLVDCRQFYLWKIQWHSLFRHRIAETFHNCMSVPPG